MCRHGVPHRPGLKLCQTHLQLAGTLLKHIVDDKMIDYAVVVLLHLAGGERVGFQRTFAAVDADDAVDGVTSFFHRS